MKTFMKQAAIAAAFAMAFASSTVLSLKQVPMTTSFSL